MRRLAPRAWPAVVALLSSACWPSATAAAVPAVDVSLRAAFPSPPYLIELLETAAQENETAYFPLLDRIAEGAFSAARTDQELYEQFLQVLRQDGHVARPEALSTFKLALALRSAAPRIEAHYQYYASAVAPLLPSGEREACPLWWWVDGQQYCDAQREASRGSLKNNSQDRTLAFDRLLGAGPRTVILYADITSPRFAAYHRQAAAEARRGDAVYRVRYKPDPRRRADPLPVTGYGVELALKKTDYIVIDDRESAAVVDDAAAPGEPQAQKPVVDSGEKKKEQQQQKRQQQEVEEEEEEEEEEELADLPPLEKSELARLGLKAASFVLQSEAPFETLLRLTQDFPKYSAAVAAHNVSAAFEAEHRANRRQMVPAGANVLWMNGVQLADRQIQPFALVDLLRRERKLIRGVLDLGLTGPQAVALLGHAEVAAVKAADDEPRRYDWRDDAEGGRVVVWLNNLEKDRRYAAFADDLAVLLYPTPPGGLPQLRRHLFHLVVPVDFAKLSDLQLVVDQLLALVKRAVPIRFGLVPLVPSDESLAQAKIVYHLLDRYGLAAVAAYLEHWVEAQKAPRNSRAAFEKAIKGRPPRRGGDDGDGGDDDDGGKPLSWSDLTAAGAYDERIEQARRWAARLGVVAADDDHGAAPPAFFDGLAIPRDPGWFATVQQYLAQDLRAVQQALYYGLLDEDAWLPGQFLERAVHRRNDLILPEDPHALRVLDVHRVYADHGDLWGRVPVLDADPGSTRDDWAALTVLADLGTADGRRLLLDALQFRRRPENAGLRLDIVHNPADRAAVSPSVVNARLAVDELAAVQTLADLDALLEQGAAEPDPAFDAALARFLAGANIRPGDSMLVLNGRVVGPIPSSSSSSSSSSGPSFGPADFAQLLEVERAQRIRPVYRALDDLGLGDRASSPLAAARLTAVTALSTVSDLPEGIFESAPALRVSAFHAWNATHTAFEVGDRSTATVQLVAALDPASELGQKWAPLLRVLSRLEGVHLRVFLNPRDELSELPVRRFYRYVLDAAPAFDARDGRVRAPSARFAGLPSAALLTVGLDVPPAWLVAPRAAVDDLDNLQLGEIRARRRVDTVEAVYALEHILVEGHSRQVPGGGAPRGVQLVLATEADPRCADTIIMANLGYFQFRANPGVYALHLERERGRSADVFEIESVGAAGYRPVAGDEGTEVVLMDFQGTTLYPRLRRRPGMETADVLEDPDAADEAQPRRGLVAQGLQLAGGLLGGGGGRSRKGVAAAPSRSDAEHAEINIFSVASGHLYERMLNIMMVSVMKHTNHTVKFWFVEQFLSPSFKDFIPALADAYGFTYEMVTYKWPHWLRPQREKQRQIWGYKILFLDVLFPLSLDKVLFVDADQVVRADLHELVRHDLEGAPYGFAPMCDSRVEMEGFRFWKQGYWANYLRGRPYHISALYVVDLRRFRALAAGDRLRQQYHTLSADPQSLANLDQDLPNHMQFVIPIHSLPQDWLWCETWCSDESLPRARTIDLCNNPLTKEPKLDRARRQVPEWTEYDEEIAALAAARRRRGAAARDEGDAQQQQQQQIPLGGEEKQTSEGPPEPRKLEDGEVEDGEVEDGEVEDGEVEDADVGKTTHVRDEL